MSRLLFRPLAMCPPLAGLLLLLALASMPAVAQDQVQTLTYRNGRLQGQLPYGRPFAVQGLTLQPSADQRATVVELRIYPEADRRRRIRQQRSLWRKLFRPDQPVDIRFQDQPYFQSFWWWTADKDSSQFDFYVDPPLQLDTYYQFELNFYHRYRIEDALTQQIVDSVKRAIFADIRRQGKLSVRVADIEEALNRAVRAYTRGLDFGYLEPTADQAIRFDTLPRRISLPLAQFSAETGLLIGQVIQQEQILADANQKVAAYQADTVAALLSDQRVQGLLTRLERAYQQEQLQLTDGSAQPGFDLIDLDAFRAFLKRGEVSYDPFPALIAYAQSPAGQQRLAENDALVLKALQRNYFQPLLDLIEAQARVRRRIASLNQRLGQGGLDRLIAEGFVQANSATFINTPFSQPRREDQGSDNSNRRLGEPAAYPSTGYNAINIGTTYGVGLVGLNFPNVFDLGETPFATTQPNLITYAGAKFYFNRIDRARFIEDPYPLFRDRFSMLVGVRITGQLTYQGRDLGNVVGAQPVGGLCFDLNRTLSLDLGFIFFSESSLSPLDDTQRLRAAPFVGLSLDANAFNFVRRNVSGLQQP